MKKIGKYPPRTIIIALLGTVSVIGAYLWYRSNSVPPFVPTTSPISTVVVATPTPDLTIKFDVTKIKVGDRIGLMKVRKVGGFFSGPATRDDFKVAFTGKVTVTGKVDFYKGGEMGEAVCMSELDEVSLSKMPKALQDYRVIWFCFENLEFAKTELSEKATATVEVDNYAITFFPRAVFNSATLVSVKK